MGKSKDQKVYMPLVHGDWLKGTQGMKAEVRGVYINLLLYQWNEGFIPSDWDDLCSIDPEVVKVWDKLQKKFIQVAPGQLQNAHLEEIREFWKKQKKNGKKGGRPKNINPEVNPTTNPNNNPNSNLHNDLDIDNESDLKNKEGAEFSDYEQWTDDVISGNDWLFADKLRNLGIEVNGKLSEYARSHLALLAKYPKMQPGDQNKFRFSLIGHIEEKLKQDGAGKKFTDKGTAHAIGLMEGLKQHYGGSSPGG